MPVLETLERELSKEENFQRYYEEAGPDYAAWSPAFNMHFGFFRWGMNPFKREAMLEQMNREILRRLQVTDAIPARILDMGCGLGATLRSLAHRLPHAWLQGITLVPWQLEQGRLLNRKDPRGHCVSLTLGDYEHTAFPSASFDAVYALESSCYARGASKSAFIKEAHRVLRPGGRIVVADGFLGPRKLWGAQKIIYRRVCECWVLDTFGEVDQFRCELQSMGFRDIVIEPMKFRVAPSVLHVPWVTLKFLLATLMFRDQRMTRARWNNVLAPILLPFVSFPLGPVSYYIISATRAG